MTEDEFLQQFAARLGLGDGIESEADLEAALARSLGFDRYTERWAIEWFADLRRRGKESEAGDARVVQEQPPTPGPGLPEAPAKARAGRKGARR